MAYLMGIDLGTSGTKTQIFSEDGFLVCTAISEYPVISLRNGWNEQQPELWRKAVIDTVSQVVAEFKSNGHTADEIKGIGISGQMHGLVMLDKNGQVIRPAIIWSDQRTVSECEEITELVGRERLLQITANPALPGFTASKILWVRNHEPENYNRCRKILLPKDYIRYCLSNEFATEVSDASGMQLLDIGARTWSQEVLDKLQIDSDLLAPVYESIEVTSQISQNIANLTGLKVGTPIVGGAGDNAAAAIGTGVVREGKAFTTIGSSGVVYAHTDSMKIETGGRIHTFCCAVPGAWHCMGVTQAAGLSYKWFKDNFCQAEVEFAKENKVNVYEILNQLASTSIIGSRKLLYLPYLNGERTPHLDANCRGVFFGLSSMHTKADLVRSVLEGVSFSQLDCLNLMRDMDLEFSQMLVTGGGASNFWRQMLADVYNCPVSNLANNQGPALGVALLAGVGVGIYSSVQAACDKAVTIADTSRPDYKNFVQYQKYYHLYKSLYPTLKKSWCELSNLEEV